MASIVSTFNDQITLMLAGGIAFECLPKILIARPFTQGKYPLHLILHIPYRPLLPIPGIRPVIHFQGFVELSANLCDLVVSLFGTWLPQSFIFFLLFIHG